MADRERARPLTPAETEAYEERAAILEFEANLPRSLAERMAWRLVVEARRPRLPIPWSPGEGGFS